MFFRKRHRFDAPQAVSELWRAIAALEKRMATLDDLKADVDAQGTVIGSAITLLQGLSDKIASAGTDPAKLDALKQEIDDQTSALAAAVTANTPAGNTSGSAPAAPSS